MKKRAEPAPLNGLHAKVTNIRIQYIETKIPQKLTIRVTDDV